jgi:hypothetical protein
MSSPENDQVLSESVADAIIEAARAVGLRRNSSIIYEDGKTLLQFSANENGLLRASYDSCRIEAYRSGTTWRLYSISGDTGPLLERCRYLRSNGVPMPTIIDRVVRFVKWDGTLPATRSDRNVFVLRARERIEVFDGSGNIVLLMLESCGTWNPHFYADAQDVADLFAPENVIESFRILYPDALIRIGPNGIEIEVRNKTFNFDPEVSVADALRAVANKI